MTYQFEPGAAADGVTVHVPLSVLNRVQDTAFDWQVPGLREELVAALLRTLPKPIRRLLVPVPEHAAATVRVMSERGIGPAEGPLTEVLARLLRETHGVSIAASDWDVDRLPAHLRMTFVAERSDGGAVASAGSIACLLYTSRCV